jgi:hypothetical protein
MVAYEYPPPPPPSEPRKGKAPYTHDGFFLRGAVGPGLFRAWTGGADTRHFSGGTVSGEISMGGTPGKGFVFGGSLLLNKVFALSSHDDIVDGDEPSLDGVGFSLNAFGVFADFYPDPKGGLDFHLFLGLGTLVTTRPNDRNLDQPTGALLSAGVGYDWFVGPQLSLGVHARVSGGNLDVNETATGDRTVTTLVPAILFAVTYH